MNLKKLVFTFVALLFVMSILPTSANALTFAEYVYKNAKINNLSKIKKYLDRGYNIDAPSPDGKTALCLALEQQDHDTYLTLKSLGANTSHPCTKKISKTTAPKQEQKTITTKQKQTTKTKSTSTSTKKPKKASQFAKQSSNTKYIIGGALVAAGGAAIALSGGGGGGSSKKTPSTPTPDKPDVPVNPDDPDDPVNPDDPDEPVNPDDPDDPVNPDDPDVPVNPDDPDVPVTPDDPDEPVNPDDPDVPVNPDDPDEPVTPDDPIIPEEPEEPVITCDEGFGLINGECVPINPETGCLEGEKLVNGKCEKIECPEGFHLIGNTCMPNQAHSENIITIEQVIGTDEDGEPYLIEAGGQTLTQNQSIENLNSNKDIFGLFSTQDNAYNLFSIYEHPETYKEINIKNTGYGRVTGVYGEENVINSYVDGYRQKNLDEFNPKSDGTAKINIKNEGAGSVYGLYSKILDAQNTNYAANAYAEDDATSRGIINIENTGNGNTYGVFSDDRAYNAGSISGGTAYGEINIKGNGNITGVGAYMAIMNSHSNQRTYGKYSEGIINIDSYGDGNIYGLHVKKDDKETNNTVVQWFAINAAGSYNDTAVGMINIKNTGNGNVYGMYGGQRLYNTLAYGYYPTFAPVENTSNITGTIKIRNYGNGNVYGMYMPNADAYGEITNNSFIGNERLDGTLAEVKGTIDIVNTGNGITTGMRGSQFNFIENSGTININNIGDGTAIGIYGERHSEIKNSGTINITRNAYTDETTNITHTPKTAIGGTAYGIYAEAQASVKNSGTINIENAASGAGIYLEEGATLENTGTIIFNGENQDHTTGGALNIYNEPTEDDVTPTVTDLNTMGKGEFLLGSKGVYVADVLKGNLGVANSTVTGSFDNTYTLTSAIKANNTKDLNLYSKSAMFNATTKDTDVILTRNNFNDLLENKDLANFFEKNYEENQNLALFDKLKQADSLQALTKTTNNITGNDIIPTFKRQNKIVQQNISQTFDDNLFNNENKNYIAGIKYIDISNKSTSTLEKNEGKATSAYGLLKNKTNSGITYGIGANITKLSTDYDNDSKRTANQLGLWLPFGYDFNNGLKWYSKLYTGYSDSSYDRTTSLGTHSADYNEYQVGLDNEIRYTIDLQNNLIFQPLLELNLQHFYQDEIKEKSQNNALLINSQNQTSLELGLGANLKKEHTFNDRHSLTIQIGGIYYVELLNPDTHYKASIKNMHHRFNIKNKESSSRANLQLKATYKYKDLTLYGNIEQEINDDKSLLIDTGLQYNF